jgi:hypothetical protein
MKWFRFWNDSVNDIKLLQLSDYEYRIWTYLLSYASSIDSVSGQLQTTFKSLSLHFHQRFNHFSRCIETFQNLGLITVDEQGFITIINWNKRQFLSDNAYERVKKYRELKKKRNVSSNVSVTAPETETETERKKYIKKEKIEFQENHFVNIPDAFMEKWKSIAPGISVRQEITKAEAWVLSNPKLKKSNWSRFLTNWIVRAQDRAHNTGGTNGDRPEGRRMGGDRLQPVIIPPEYKGDGPRPDVSPETVRANLQRIARITGGIGKGGIDLSNHAGDEWQDSQNPKGHSGGSH